MALWMRERWYCTNAGSCRLCTIDHPYPQAGSCTGDGTLPGCGKPLARGTPINNRRRNLILVCLLGGGMLTGVVWLQPILFPQPVAGVYFESSSATIAQGSAQSIRIKVVRNRDLKRAVDVHWHTEDGTAKAPTDYLAGRGSLVFAPGEASKILEVQVLDVPVGAEKSFVLKLDNVIEGPLHRITIAPPKAAPELIEKAVVWVRSVSNLSKDIADFYVQIEVKHALIASGKVKYNNRAIFERILGDLETNLSDAGKRYRMTLSDLAKMDTVAVNHAFDSVIDELQKRSMHQQMRTTEIARKHFEGVRKGEVIRPDQWAKRLAEVIPRTPEDGTPIKQL